MEQNGSKRSSTPTIEPAPQPDRQLDLARKMGVRLVQSQMTMDLLGLSREDMVPGLDEPAGATTALLAAQDAVTLFIWRRNR